MSEPLLTIRNLKVAFKHENQWLEAIHGIDLDVMAGRTLGLVGESGSGKSVSSLAVMHLLNERVSRIKADSICIEGEEIKGYSERQMAEVRGKRIAMIFQEPMTSLNPVYKCGFQVSEMILQHEKVTQAKAKERVIELFKQVMLPRPEAIYDSYPHELSGGQKQRVMIAMAIACNPQLLIADEPTTALDVTVQLEILKLLRKLQNETGMGMIFITHDLGVVAEIADDVAVMHNGEILERGTVQEILNHPQHPYTQGLLACRPPMDIRLKRLPIVKEFLDGQWQGGKAQILHDLQITEEERKAHHEQLYSKQPLLKVENLKQHFKISRKFTTKAVDGISLDVRDGETVGLVGESGCGKTTTGRAILKLIEPTSGQIIYKGEDISSYTQKQMLPLRHEMQMVFQDPYASLNPRMSVIDIVTDPLIEHKIITRDEKQQKATELLETVGLDPRYMNRFPHEFSGGQRQRIGIARSLALKPKILICDEPIAALDVSIQAQVINLFQDLQEKLGLSYIFIAHDLSVVRHISDRIIVMYLGKIVETASKRDLFKNPLHPYTKVLLSSVPTPDPALERERRRIELTGEVPSPLNKPKGCPFCTRCPDATEQCREMEPPVTEIENGHTVACHKFTR